jgi:hypothetical protein
MNANGPLPRASQTCASCRSRIGIGSRRG